MRRRSVKTRFRIFNNPKLRASLYQLALLAALAWLGWIFETNARANLAAQGFASGFDFLTHTAGFGVSQSLIPYQETRQYVKRVLRSYREYHRLERGTCSARSLDKVC